MADRQIIFSAPMVRALLAGTKTQTRRIVKPAPRLEHFASEQLEDFELRGFEAIEQPDGRHLVYRPAWRAGDRLWVRESVQANAHNEGDGGRRYVKYVADGSCFTLADSAETVERWVKLLKYGSTSKKQRLGEVVPSIHMPRWASRLTLDVAEVSVQRLQDISEEDARAEGITEAIGWWWTGAEGQAGTTPRAAYAVLWNSLHGSDGWKTNPFVVALTFSVTPANIDNLAERSGATA